MSVKLLKFNKLSDEEDSLEEITVVPPVVLGRGSLLKCGEKKASRKHAILDWDENGVIITSTHSCFTYVSVNGKESTLAEGECATLLDGDSFGLFPQSFWYKVILPLSKRNDEDLNHVNADTLAKPPSKSLDECVPLKVVEERDSAVSVDKDDRMEDRCQVQVDEIQENPSLQSHAGKSSDHHLENDHEVQKIPNESAEACVSTRKRDIPAWMTNQAFKKSPDDTKMAKKDPDKGEEQVAQHGKKKPNKTSALKRKLKDESNSTVQQPKDKISKPRKNPPPKKRSKAKQYHCMSLEMEDPIPCNSSAAHDISDEEGEEGAKSPAKGDTPPEATSMKSPVTSNLSPKTNDSASSPTGQTSSTSSASSGGNVGAVTKPSPPPINKVVASLNAASNPKNKQGQRVRRSSCPFGENCYRKNPQHKIDTAHPGDSDYASEPGENDSDDDRPECEFGITCYRKNPQHKAAFKHTRKPQPPRNTKRRAKKRKGDDEEEDSENEYDYDDPFLNDSSDDYAPTDSNSDYAWSEGDEEQDTKRTLKEAKLFVKS